LNQKILVITLLLLTLLALALEPLPLISAQSQRSSVSISEVSPNSLSGPVGQAVNVQGTIYTYNGGYQIIFGSNVVGTGASTGYSINANFIVPEIPAGSYNLTLKDVTTGVTSTDQFQVTTTYSINAIPSQIQEGDSILVNVTVTGGQPTTPYNADVSIALPSPLNTEYSKIISLGDSTQKGTANAQVNFPDSSFQPTGSLTDYAGSYTLYFNQTSSLAQNQFSVGFLDFTNYHRGQTVNVRATGYQPNQVANVTINNDATSTAIDSLSLTASANGTITATWIVSSNAPIGDYAVQITTSTLQKLIQDSESFSITGYSIQIKTVNLAGQVVSGVKVQALDLMTNLLYNNTASNNGIANLNLEAGSVSLTAFWSAVNVGQSNITVTGAGTFTLQCELTNLKVLVQNENGVPLPFVNLAISYQYQPENGGSQSGTASGQTDISGTYTLNSTLIGISYNITASLYNQVFNANQENFKILTSTPISQVVITCPSEALTINVVGYNETAIPNARVELVELTTGLFYTQTTNSSASVTSQVTFGMYRARVYKEDILLNETNINVFGDSTEQLHCTLYGISVKVSVVDLLGNPIPNANVTLTGPATERFSAITQGSGTATFSDVIGGNMQIVTFASGASNDYQSMTLTINQPTNVQIKLDKYIDLGPLIVQVNTLIAIIVILLAVVLLAVVEIFRRKRAK